MDDEIEDYEMVQMALIDELDEVDDDSLDDDLIYEVLEVNEVTDELVYLEPIMLLDEADERDLLDEMPHQVHPETDEIDLLGL